MSDQRNSSGLSAKRCCFFNLLVSIRDRAVEREAGVQPAAYTDDMGVAGSAAEVVRTGSLTLEYCKWTGQKLMVAESSAFCVNNPATQPLDIGGEALVPSRSLRCLGAKINFTQLPASPGILSFSAWTQPAHPHFHPLILPVFLSKTSVFFIIYEKRAYFFGTFGRNLPGPCPMCWSFSTCGGIWHITGPPTFDGWMVQAKIWILGCFPLKIADSGVPTDVPLMAQR